MAPAEGKLALVTGTGGFLGREIAHTFKRAGYRVQGIGHGERPHGPSDEPIVDGWTKSDVDYQPVRELVLRSGTPDIVVHAAGGSSVHTARKAPLDDFRRTVAATAGVLEALRETAPQARLLMVSSAAVYGNHHHGPIPEDSPLDPISYYGVHKRAAEELCTAAARHWGLDLAVVRFFSLYGAGLRKQIFWDLSEKFRARPVRIELGGTGAETRDFLHVQDAARLLLHLSDGSWGESPFIVNGGTGKATSIRQAAEELANACSTTVNTVFDGHQRPGDPSHLVADTDRLHACGFRPAVSLADGLASFAEWHGKQPRETGEPLNRAEVAG